MSLDPALSALSPPADAPQQIGLVDEFVSLPVWMKALSIAMISYVLVVSVQRFSMCFDPWVAETDWKQWVWQYWRYNIKGAFPAGHVITDYTFNAQPPLYHLVMMALSSVMKPVVAANIVNFVSWALACWACVVAVRRRTHLLVGLACAMLFVHDAGLHRITMGGYPRSFGPTLTLLFMAAWLNGRHRLVLLVLVCAAAVYPSVCVPCGLAYGIWTALTAPRTSLKSWLRPNLEVVAAGVVVCLLGQLQSLTAPAWWGPVVWASEAGVALTAKGRTAWLPLDPLWPTIGKYLQEPWATSGVVWAKSLPWTEATARQVGWLTAFVVAVVGVAVNLKSGVRRLPAPAQMFLLLACAMFSFWLANEVAFKLYLPRRMVQHTLPSIMFVTLCLLFFTTGVALFGHRSKAAVFVLLALLTPTLVLSGDGFAASSYKSYAKNEKLFRWIEKNTKVTDQFGGYYRILDEIPFFAARQVYVNWKMAHPFRLGFYAEIDRRTVEMYDAYFATDLRQLQAFLAKRDIAYFVVNDDTFATLEGGDSQLFEPTRSKILKGIFRPRLAQGFVLQDPPREIVAFRQGSIRVLSRDKLEAWLARQPASSTPAATGAPAEPTPTPTKADDEGSATGTGTAEAGDD